MQKFVREITIYLIFPSTVRAGFGRSSSLILAPSHIILEFMHRIVGMRDRSRSS